MPRKFAPDGVREAFSASFEDEEFTQRRVRCLHCQRAFVCNVTKMAGHLAGCEPYLATNPPPITPAPSVTKAYTKPPKRDRDSIGAGPSGRSGPAGPSGGLQLPSHPLAQSQAAQAQFTGLGGLHVDLAAPNGFKYTQPTGLFINNEFVPSSWNTKIATIDPATEQQIAVVEAATAEDVGRAVEAARKALKAASWKKMDSSARGLLLFRLADLIQANASLLATIDAWDNGKTYSEALNNDIPEAVNVLRYYAGWADKVHGQTISTIANKLAYTIRQPVGVVAQIIPWNYPLSMAAWKLGPALACGNTVVLKPAEQTPLSALLLARLIVQAGFPPGVVNIVNGFGHEAGAALVQHHLVDKVAFTGSTQTGKTIMALAARTMKNITLETGGKSPLLVFADCDLQQAVAWSHLGIMSNQGQICTATSRIMVESSVYPTFVTEFVAKVEEKSKVGMQWDEHSYQGPLVSRSQYDRVLAYIQAGRDEGATVAYGGTTMPNINNGKGFFVSPTVMTDVNAYMTVWKEEIFGPVVVISPFETEVEAISRANDTTYGLGAAVFTSDLERAHRVSAEMEAGMVWINSSQDCDTRLPFGGIKQSGIGRELGEAGLDAYSQIKTVHINMGNRI